LTGELPFRGNSAIEKLMARVTDDAPPVSSLRPECPAELDAIVARMLCRHPADRFQTPAEVAEALTPFLSPSGGDDATTCLLQAPARSENFELPLGADETLRDFFSQLGSQASERTPRSGTLQRRATTHKRLTKAEMAVSLGALAVLMATLAFAFYWTRPGWIVLSWPVEDRRGARLDIDGKEIELPDKNPAQVRVDPGEHRVVARRRGYQPIEWDVSVGRARSVSLTPEWQAAGGGFSDPLRVPESEPVP
jgi:hypothetical protein